MGHMTVKGEVEWRGRRAIAPPKIVYRACTVS